MNTRTFGRTGWQVSEIGFGAWGIGGGQWGGADEAESMATLHAALDSGITFFDTADVYGDGLSERLIGRLRRERPSSIAASPISASSGSISCSCIARPPRSTTGPKFF
jgi:aryl-alcohol dehydrogenase-like predicted oxidoreductase